MFKKLIVLPLFVFSSISFAGQSVTQTGGFEGPTSERELSVEQVLEAQDETLVSITGHIISKQGSEDYWFEDKTGRIEVEIDQRLFKHHKVTPNTLVTIMGEVDKDWNEISVDADKLTIN